MPSLPCLNLLRCTWTQIVGFVCTDSKDFEDSSRHYWFLEFEDGHLRYAFDSLKGLQRLTQELAKKLVITGVLLVLGPKKNPVFRTTELDSVAGVLPQIVRAPNPIRVLGRQQANKIRNFLYRAHGIKKKRHLSIKNVQKGCYSPHWRSYGAWRKEKR